MATGSKFIELLKGIYGGKFELWVTYLMRHFIEREHRKRFYVFVENIPCTLLTKKTSKMFTRDLILQYLSYSGG